VYIEYKNFIISDEKDKLQFNNIVALLRTTYWAKNRAEETIKKSIDTSLCFGVFEIKTNQQIGFARCATDFCTAYWLCDVVIDKEYRGLGLGKRLIEFIVEHDELKGLMGILSSRDSQELYKKTGFKLSTSFMRRKP